MSREKTPPASGVRVARAMIPSEQLCRRPIPSFSKLTVALLAVCALCVALAAPASAVVTYAFDHIEEPGDDAAALANGAIGEAQMRVDVAPYDQDRVIFTFRNIGPQDSTITDVYFDRGSLLGAAEIVNPTGVLFSNPAKPAQLSGADFVADFSAGSSPPPVPNGVDPGETLAIIFNLDPDTTLADILAAIGSRELSIGFKVQGFDSEGSESFIVPEPAVMWLLGTALIVLGLLGRKRKEI